MREEIVRSLENVRTELAHQQDLLSVFQRINAEWREQGFRDELLHGIGNSIEHLKHMEAILKDWLEAHSDK